MAVKKSQLYSSLWASCDKLRGGMDASQYKDYILTLLFVKYVSDKYKDDPYGAIAIPEGASFEDLVALKGNKNIGEEIDKLIAKLAEANNLTGIINNAHFNDESKIGKGDEMVDKLTGLIAIFQKPELDFKNNKAEDDDLIGDAYEYKEDLQSIEAHLYGGIPQEDIDNIPHFWNVFPNLKKEIFGEYKHESCHAELVSASTKGFYKLLIQKDDVHKTITENAEFLEYNKKVNKAFEEWKAFANPILTNLKPTDSNKEIILKLSEEILSKFTKLELLDKYDVYQVLLAYWNETMNDDVLLVIQDELGYKLAKVTDDIKEEPKESKKSKKDSAKEKKTKEAKVIGWEGRLIPKQIVLDAFFETEQKAIEEAEEKLSQTESEFEEFVEENCVDDAEDDELSQEPEILKKCKTYEASIKSQKKTIADLKKKLDENCRKRYDTFTDSEITDLLVNRKWYKTIDQGIQNLYVTVANHLTKRIVELYERYESPPCQNSPKNSQKKKKKLPLTLLRWDLSCRRKSYAESKCKRYKR